MKSLCGYLVSFVCGLSVAFAVAVSIAKFFGGDSSDKSEPRKDTSDI